jgi:hypothetical protein
LSKAAPECYAVAVGKVSRPPYDPDSTGARVSRRLKIASGRRPWRTKIRTGVR